MAGKSRYQSRDKRFKQIYKGACEGRQEELYLKRLKKLIYECESRTFDVDFFFFSSQGGNPMEVVERASNVTIYDKGQQRVAIFDHDQKEAEFRQALDKCKVNNVFSAYSNLCFDLWLILHKTRFTRCVNNTGQYAQTIREVYNLPENADIKNEDVINQILAQLQLQDIRQAIQNAFVISKNNDGTGTPSFSEKSVQYYPNPDLAVHLFVQKVLHDTRCN